MMPHHHHHRVFLNFEKFLKHQNHVLRSHSVDVIVENRSQLVEKPDDPILQQTLRTKNCSMGILNMATRCQ